jgi:ribonucleoside-diphosphate reductase alpha chain
MKLSDLPLDGPVVEPQAISTDVLLEKYAKGSETSIDDVQSRVARALAEVEPPDSRSHWQAEFTTALRSGFIPAGRINSAAGTDIRATLINCFVQPVGDSVSEDVGGKPSIYKALAQSAETMRRGGGVGYDFSRIRPRGALVKGTHSNASGPVSYIRVFDRSCETVESAGSRRGAQMGILRCDHPDVLEFVQSKDRNALSNFNISVAITDAFMRAVEADAEIELVHEAEPVSSLIEAGACRRPSDGLWVYRRMPARDLMDRIMQSTYDHADPGVVFIDRMNAENNLHYIETLEATNPCGEQPLPDYACCCLGSIDLTRFVRRPFSPDASFDLPGFASVVRTAVRMLDNVLDVTYWPLAEQRREAQLKRRIGLGYLGLGSALVMMGVHYNSDHGYSFGTKVAELMRDEAYAASIALAAEKGAFPALDADRYLQSSFAERLPASIRDQIRKTGLRNSHLLSIAPTGTIALAFADNASNGIEPAFAWTYTRKKRMPDGSIKHYEVEDRAYRLFRVMGGDMHHLPDSFVSAHDMSAEQHMRMLEAVQPFIDSSISKTVNVPKDYPFDDFKQLYIKAWKAGLKGLATYRPNDVTGSVLSVDGATPPVIATEGENDDPLRKQFDSRPPGELEGPTAKVEYWTSEGKKSVYLTVNFMRVQGRIDGEPVEILRPVEFFMPAGQRDEGQQWIASNMRLLSLVGRSGGSIAKALANMREVVWDRGPVHCGHVLKPDGTKARRWHDSEVAAIGYALQQILAQRGFLDSDGRQIPVKEMAIWLSQQAGRLPRTAVTDTVAGSAIAAVDAHAVGKRCPECGAREMHRRDGCDACASCGYIGQCA